MEHRKPTLACDADLTKIRFPVIVQPKIDGVRGCNFHGKLTGRSLKPHANVFVTNQFSKNQYLGFDGEFACERDTHPDLCRMTTSVMSTITGEPFVLWHIFDFVNPLTYNLPYYRRMEELTKFFDVWKHVKGFEHIRIVPSVLCHNMEQLLQLDEQFLSQGYEGTIIRDPNGIAKEGRSTARQGILLRIKRFIEEEALVVSITEGEANHNEATVNELGRTARSSHQENKVANGMVGSLECKLLKDILDPQTKQVILHKDQIITVSPGNMDHEDREHFFHNQHFIVGKVIKFKFFPKGIKDKPRFPTFVTIRSLSDMV